MSLLSQLDGQLITLAREITRGKSINSMNVRSTILWLVEFAKSEESEELREIIQQYEIQKQMRIK
jgi:hypothetical protein